MDRYAVADANNANLSVDTSNSLYSDYRNDRSGRLAYNQGYSDGSGPTTVSRASDQYYSTGEYQPAVYQPYNERQVITVPPNVPYDQSGQPPIIIVDGGERRHHGADLARGVGSFLLAALSGINIGVYGRHGGFHLGNGYYGGWNHCYGGGYGGYGDYGGGWGGGYYNPGYGGGYYNPGCGGGYNNPGYGGGYYNPGYGGGYYNHGYGGGYYNPGYGGGYYNHGYGGYGGGMLNLMINSFGHHHGHHNYGGWGHGYMNYMNYGFSHHRRHC